MDENHEVMNNIMQILPNFINGHWDDIVNGKFPPDDAAWHQLNLDLIDATSEPEIPKQIISILQNGGDRSFKKKDNKCHIFLANAMVDVFLKYEHSLDNWLMLLDWWNIYTEFKALLTNEAKDNNGSLIDKLEKITKEIFSHPENITYGDEKSRIISYMERWKKENNITELWVWGSRDFFPYDSNAFLFPQLLSQHKPEKFFEVSALMKAPCLLYEMFAGCSRTDGYIDLLVLLKKAPSSVIVNNGNMKWNQNWIAPILVDEFYQKVSGEYLEKQRNMCIVGDVDEKFDGDRFANKNFSELGTILRDRVDGVFLAWSYVQYLQTKKIGNQHLAKLCIKVLSDSLHNEFRVAYLKKDTLQQFFSGDIQVITKHFKETGLLEQGQETSAYLSLGTHIQFNCSDINYITSVLPYVETSMMFDDEHIASYNAKPDNIQTLFSDLYLNSCPNNPVGRWLETWNLFRVARQRIFFDYYDDNSFKVRKNMNGLILIGYAVLKKLKKANDISNADLMWKNLWHIMFHRMKYTYAECDDFNIEFIRQLSELKINELNELDQDNAKYEHLIDMMISLSSYPKLYLDSIDMLEKRDGVVAKIANINPDRMTLLVNKCHDAVIYCEGIDYRETLVNKGKPFLKRYRNWLKDEKQGFMD